MVFRKFPLDCDPANLNINDLVTTEDSMSNWRVTERLTAFPIFVLKNELSGESVMTVAREYPAGNYHYFLREIRDPKKLRISQRDAQRRSRRKKKLTLVTG